MVGQEEEDEGKFEVDEGNEVISQVCMRQVCSFPRKGRRKSWGVPISSWSCALSGRLESHMGRTGVRTRVS